MQLAILGSAPAQIREAVTPIAAAAPAVFERVAAGIREGSDPRVLGGVAHEAGHLTMLIAAVLEHVRPLESRPIQSEQVASAIDLLHRLRQLHTELDHGASELESMNATAGELVAPYLLAIRTSLPQLDRAGSTLADAINRHVLSGVADVDFDEDAGVDVEEYMQRQSRVERCARV